MLVWKYKNKLKEGITNIEVIKSQRRQINILNTFTTDLKSRTKRIKELIKYKHVTEEKRIRINNLIKEYQDCFSLKGNKLGKTDIITHRILLADYMPVIAKSYRFPHALKGELDKQINEL